MSNCNFCKTATNHLTIEGFSYCRKCLANFNKELYRYKNKEKTMNPRKVGVHLIQTFGSDNIILIDYAVKKTLNDLQQSKPNERTKKRK